MSWKAIGFEQPNFDEAPLLAMNPYHLAEEDGKIGVYQLAIPKILLIPIEYDYIKRVSVTSHTFFIVGINRKYGVYNSEGKLIIEVIYDKISVNDNLIIVCNSCNGKAYGAYDFNGNHIVPDVYANITQENDVIVVRSHSKKYGVYSYDGKLIIPVIYIQYRFKVYDEGDEVYIWVKTKNQDCGLYDKQGKTIVPVKYNKIDLCENFIIADTDHSSTVYDYDGNVICEESDYQYHSYYGKMIVRASKEGIKIYDQKGKEVEEGVSYEAIYMMHPEFLAAKKDGHWKILYSV